LVAHLSAQLADTFLGIDYFVWAAFVVEYLVKLYLAPSRRRFITHHLIDLAIVALSLLRPLRILRLLPLLNFVRAGVVLANALKRAKTLFTHRGLHFVLLAVLGIVFVGSALELVFEQTANGSTIHNFGDALWWAIVTVTTVGYGDKYPVSAGGRGIAVVLMLVDIGLIGILTATVASYFIEQGDDTNSADLNIRLDRIEALLTRVAAATDYTPSSPTSLNRPRFDSEQYTVSEIPTNLLPTINLAHSVSATQQPPAPAPDSSPSQ